MLTDVRPAADRRSGERGLRADIQGLRALAVILVIGNHANTPGFGAGYIGVDVFFVISGYVITQLLMREAPKGRRAGLADFYARRVRRIVPAATLTLVGTLLVSEAVLGSRVDPNLPSDVRWASLFVANFRMMATGTNYFVPGIHPSLVTQFWSLAVEEQFYLVFPLVLFTVYRYSDPARRLRVMAAVLGAGIGLSAAWSAYESAAHPIAGYYSPFTRFWELGLGCLLAISTTGRPVRTIRSEHLAAAGGAALIVAALVEFGPSTRYPGAAAWLPCLGTALLLWAGITGERTALTRILSVRPLRYVGDISYSLYLAHYIWLKLPEQVAAPLTGPAWRSLEIAGTFVTAMVSYHLLENPVRRSRRLAGDRVSVALLLAVCVAASWAAAAVVGHHLAAG